MWEEDSMNNKKRTPEGSDMKDFIFIFILSGGIVYLSMKLFFDFSFLDIFHTSSYDAFLDEMIKIMICFLFQMNIILEYLREKWKVVN